MPVRFRGGNALIRSSWETSGLEGIPLYAGPYLDHRMIAGEAIAIDAPTIENTNLSPNEQASEGAPTKIGVGGTIPVNWEPENLFRFLAQFQQNAATPVVLTAGQSWRHKLAPSESDVDLDLGITSRLWRDDGLILTASGGFASQMTIAKNVRGLIGGVVTMMYERATYYDFATIVLEGGSPARPVLRGLPTYTNWLLADHDIYVKCTQTAGSVQVKVKIGSASTYDGTAITVTAGTWITLTDEADAQIGDLDAPIQMYVTSTAGWTLNDEWRFKGEVTAAPWSASYPVIPYMNEIHATITVDKGDGNGYVEKRVRQFQTTLAHPTEADENIGGRFADAIVRSGNRAITYQIGRTYLDLDFVKLLLAAGSFGIDWTVTSRVLIGTSSDPYTMRGVSTLCRLTGAPPNVANTGRLPETLNATAYPNAADGTHPDDLTIYLDNNLSDLAAA